MVSDVAKSANKIKNGPFIASLEKKPFVWNHKLPGHYQKAALAREELAKEFNTTGWLLCCSIQPSS